MSRIIVVALVTITGASVAVGQCARGGKDHAWQCHRRMLIRVYRLLSLSSRTN